MIELQCINYIFQKNSFQLILLNGIDESYFVTYREQFKFLRDFYNQYNQLPSKETFQNKFDGNWEWINVTDPEEYLISKLKEAKLYREVIVSYKELAELIKAEKTDLAVEKMASISQQFLKQKQTTAIDLIDNAQIRYDSYLYRVNNPEKASVTTGLKELDDILGGWDLTNETAIIAGRTGFGKSWWLIYFALAAARQGLRVGFYSGEMETDLVGYRLDTFLGNIANGSLTHGNENVRLQYENYIETLNKVVPGHIICVTPQDLDGSATVSKLRAFVEKYDLQMLCVDQFSLLEDEKRGRTPREQMANLSKDLRTLQRLKQIPILAAAQLNREEVGDEGPTTKNISESDRIGQDATTVLFIERKQDNVTLTVGKARNAKTGDKLTYMWNINMGTLNYVPIVTDARNGEGSEELEEQYNDTAKSNSVF
jgi:replicative DNA helicase